MIDLTLDERERFELTSVQKEFMEQWKLRALDADKEISNVLQSIIKTEPYHKIPKVNLRDKTVYVGSYKYSGHDYKIALYGNGGRTPMVNAFTKVEVEDPVLLEDKEKIEHVYCDENYSDYLIIGFYEAEKEEPSLIIQVDKSGHDDWISAKKEWLKYLGLYKVYPKFEISESDIQELFPTTDKTKVKQFTDAVNEYSAFFEINTVERMSHFLGQVAVETGELRSLHESKGYSSPRRIVMTFPPAKYGHLYEKAVLQDTSYSYEPVNFTTCKCVNDPHNDGTYELLKDNLTKGTGMAPDENNEFPYINQTQVMNAYVAKRDSVVYDTIKGKPREYKLYRIANGATKDNIENKAIAKYEGGLIKVKEKYLNSIELFDVVYGCRNGNYTIDSKDGSTYRGIGVLQMTGKGMFYQISEAWNSDFRNKGNKKYFYKKKAAGGHFEELKEDYDVAVKASMYYWKIKKINSYADDGLADYAIDKVGEIINGNNPPNCDSLRRVYTLKIQGKLNK